MEQKDQSNKRDKIILETVVKYRKKNKSAITLRELADNSGLNLNTLRKDVRRLADSGSLLMNQGEGKRNGSYLIEANGKKVKSTVAKKATKKNVALTKNNKKVVAVVTKQRSTEDIFIEKVSALASDKDFRATVNAIIKNWKR